MDAEQCHRSDLTQEDLHINISHNQERNGDGMNKFKDDWVIEFTDCLVKNSIWDSFPAVSKNWSKVKVYEWLEEKEQYFKSYLGGAAWDRTLDSMMDHEFIAWNHKIERAMNECDDDATEEYNRFCSAVDSDFASRYKAILAEYRKDAGIDD